MSYVVRVGSRLSGRRSLRVDITAREMIRVELASQCRLLWQPSPEVLSVDS